MPPKAAGAPWNSPERSERSERVRAKSAGYAAGAVEVAAEDRRVAHVLARVRRLDHRAVADVQAVVVQVAPEEDDVAGLQLRDRDVRCLVPLRVGRVVEVGATGLP